MKDTALRPRDLKEALILRRETGGILYAGGTDLMIRSARWGTVSADAGRPVIFIGHLEELRQVATEPGFLVIGACAILSSLRDHPGVPVLLKRIIGSMASPAVRNMATMGGNVCNASPAGDTIPYLLAMNGTVLCASTDGQKEIPVNEFISGPGMTILAPDEVVTGFGIPRYQFDHEFHKKVAARRANALAKASIVGLARKIDHRLVDLRLAFGAVGPKVVRSPDCEQALIDSLSGTNGRHEREEILAAVLKRYARILSPIDDQRSTADYRGTVVIRLARHFLKEVLGLSHQP